MTYIAGAAHISIQTPLTDEWMRSPLRYPGEGYVRAVEPDFKDYIAPIASRRMSPIVKRAIVTARVALVQAGVAMPDAIIMGTGLGCVENTEKFLDAMVRNGEQFLQPTHFIQSTHNTISSQIALGLQCHGYNSTYVHRGISFESALLDAFVHMRLGQINTALVGGHDETTPDYYKMLSKIGYWNGASFAGEGGTSFVLTSEKTPGAMARIEAIEILHRPADLVQSARRMCAQGQVDALMLGVSGDPANDAVYECFAGDFAPQTQRMSFKDLSGEYFTASAFGLYAAVCRMKEMGLGRMLFYNHSDGMNHALILLTR